MGILAGPYVFRGTKPVLNGMSNKSLKLAWGPAEKKRQREIELEWRKTFDKTIKRQK